MNVHEFEQHAFQLRKAAAKAEADAGMLLRYALTRYGTDWRVEPEA